MKHTRPLRVVVWSTGGIGSIAVRAVHRPPDLDLVGVWVHSPEKIGRDAGELAGTDAVGLAATNDAAALIGLRPDCVVYAASGPERDSAAVPDYVRFLVNRMAPDLAPEWPIGDRDGTYRIVIEGDPDIECTMAVGDPATAGAGAMVATAMRVVNAISYVVDSAPGLVTSLDLPITVPRHAL